MTKPLRPHNHYGGTTCPARATPQVPTIRSLAVAIAEEDGEMALTFEQRVAAHEQWHRQTFDPWYKWVNDRLTQLEEAKESNTGEIAALQQENARLWRQLGDLRREVAALPAATGGGIGVGDTVKAEIKILSG